MELHDIGWAVRHLRLGHSVYRTGWNAPHRIRLKEPTKSSDMTEPYVYIVTSKDEVLPWLCSQADLLAEDWEQSKEWKIEDIDV